MKAPPLLIVAGVAGVAVVAYVLAKKRDGESMGAAAGRVLVSTAADAGVGAVKGIGEAVGIPDTNADQCSADIAAGKVWAASFSCPAPRYLKALASGAFIQSDNPGLPGNVFPSSGLSNAQAADARTLYAAQDPRRFDMQPEGSW